ncbi:MULTISPECIES: diacylglycerol kinase [Streptomyces]|uniref:Diacylglycerol kinase n=1 Tax=Streptomyces lycii TaxID=2654337 RepID=A0ABQ7FKV1_9ACTN|nr:MULTISPECIES: diacylglycerol kinase [Streptomyces]KAF4409587.1 diacylglycerol kinase [Streptomyces lycii]PGH49583.1 diacylglycerol kinase [Streptomyces sp. Ru87]
MSAPAPGGRPLLVVIDPVARHSDAESVRIVRDVLCAGAAAKICLPDGPGDLARALAHRGRRRPVIVGDDQALRRLVGLLHRERGTHEAALSYVPVGASAAAVALGRELGVPTGPVAAARAVLDGTDRRLDLLVDDSDGIVLGGLSIPGTAGAAARQPWWVPTLRGCRSLVRGRRTGSAPAPGDSAPHRLRVEADGVLLVDLDRPVEDVSVTVCAPGGAPSGAGVCTPRGTPADSAVPAPRAHVVVQTADGDRGSGPLMAHARAVTVSGPDFHYRADAVVGGPVRTRTWTVRAGALRLTLPNQPSATRGV